jgi:hypothetical protein
VNADRFELSQLDLSGCEAWGVAVHVTLKGSISRSRLFLLLWIAAEIASQNIIGAWKRKFQVLPAYIIANSGKRTEGGTTGGSPRFWSEYSPSMEYATPYIRHLF